MWTFEERNDPDVLMAHVLRRLGGARVREVLARAQGAAELAPVIEQILALRVEGLHYADRYRDPRDARLEALLPVSRVLAALGVEADGSMVGERLGAFWRHPVGLLLLEPGHLMRLGVDRRSPLRVALARASAMEEGEPARVAFEEALERFRVEERWLATFDGEPLDDPLRCRGLDYDAVRAGLAVLFDAGALGWPVEVLALKRGVAGRLLRALQARSDEAPTLAALPSAAPGFKALSGVGGGTVGLLAAALLRHARGWRELRAGLERAPSLEAALPAQASADLELGGAALTALFGGEAASVATA